MTKTHRDTHWSRAMILQFRPKIYPNLCTKNCRKGHFSCPPLSSPFRTSAIHYRRNNQELLCGWYIPCPEKENAMNHSQILPFREIDKLFCSNSKNPGYLYVCMYVCMYVCKCPQKTPFNSLLLLLLVRNISNVMRRAADGTATRSISDMSRDTHALKW
jgi:hypothetical protein